MRIEDRAAADRERGRVAANHEAIAADGNDRRLQSNLHECALAGLQLSFRFVDEADRAEEFRGEMMESDARLLFEGLRVFEQFQSRGDDLRRAQRLRRDELLSSMQSFERNVGEIHRGPFAR